MKLLFLIQHLEIKEKLKNAPDDEYQIGLLIGSFIPFVVLVIIAYYMYARAKKKNNNN